jgi:high affinity Mn2+ porin
MMEKELFLGWRVFWAVVSLGLSMLGWAEDSLWSVQGQSTYVHQYHPAFDASYTGPMSLKPEASSRETADVTLYLGRRLWEGAELWCSPEIDQGFGLNNTSGVAGYVSGEAYKVGSHTPYVRLQRFFVRQRVGLSGEQREDEGDLTHFGGQHPVNEMVFTAGRYSVADIFDTNRYAHDPRKDFFNWSVVDSGAFDYAADPWGVTQGLSLEWTERRNTLRGGLFQMSNLPNGKIAGVRFANTMWILENETRFEFHRRPGAIRLLGFRDDAPMATYNDAVSVGVANLENVRTRHQKTGWALNAEQEVSDSLGVFFRYSQNDGHHEAYEFTDINRSYAIGAQWSVNPTHRWGVAMVRNELSTEAQRFFAAGGTGILIGDGRLNYAPEYVTEIYMAWQWMKNVEIALDFQDILHPAYNQSRGPVTVWGLRLHMEF